MARGDGTGPAGAGRMTGRAAGYCAGYAIPGFANPLFGGGLGRRGGRGMGRGFRGWPAGSADYGIPCGTPAAVLTKERELDQLKDQAQYLEGVLERIGSRIRDLDSQTE